MTTKHQEKWINKITASKEYHENKLSQLLSYPRWHIQCKKCKSKIGTEDPDRAINYIRDHDDHSMLIECDIRPDAIKYVSRTLVLERLAILGKDLTDEYVLEEARTTYSFIRSEGDIEGALLRLLAIMLSTKNGHCRTYEDQRTIMEAIINDDHYFFKKLAGRAIAAKEETDSDG